MSYNKCVPAVIWTWYIVTWESCTHSTESCSTSGWTGKPITRRFLLRWRTELSIGTKVPLVGRVCQNPAPTVVPASLGNYIGRILNFWPRAEHSTCKIFYYFYQAGLVRLLVSSSVWWKVLWESERSTGSGSLRWRKLSKIPQENPKAVSHS